MLRRFAIPLIAACVVCTLLLAPVRVSAAENPTDAIPENVGVVVRLAQPQQTVQKVTDFVGQVKREYAPFVQLGAIQMGKVISNPSRAGVDPERDWWIAFFPHTDGDPSMLFMVPATDVDQMKNAVTGSFHFIEYEDWLLYTGDKELADAVQARVDSGDALSAAVDQRSRDLVAGADIGVYVNLVQLKKTYAAQIEQGRKELSEKMKEAQNFAPEVQGLNMSGIFQMYTRMFEGAFQAVDDSKAFVLSVNVDSEKITFEELLVIAADSSTSMAIARHKPSDLKGVGRLQDGQLVYFGLKCNMDSLITWGTKVWTQMLGDSEQVKQLEPKIEELKQLNFGAYYGSFSLASDGEDQGILRSTVVAEVTPVDKMRQLSREMTKAMSEMEVAGMKQEYSVQEDAETINGKSVDIMSVKQEFNQELDPLGIQKIVTDTLYGPDGMSSRLIYTDEGVVQVIGGDKAYAKTVLDALEESGTRDGALATTRQQLLETANVFGAIDLPRFAVEVLRAVVQSGQFPIPVTEQMLDDLKLAPSYMGVTITTETDGVRCKTTIPSAQVRGIVKLVEMFQGMGGQQPQF